jgi:hypothetical protein
MILSGQTPQCKSNANLKLKEGHSGLKEKNPFDKKKKTDMRKR